MTPIEDIINDICLFKDNYNEMVNQAHQALTDMETLILQLVWDETISMSAGELLRERIKSLRIILP